MNLKFLPVNPADLETLYELNQSLISQYEDLSSVNLDQILPWIKRKLTVKQDEYRAVFYCGEKVGYFRLFDTDEGALELDDLYILAPYQGRGIGSMVLLHCISESERLCKPLTLYVFSNNTRAVSLYEKHGFTTDQIVSPTRQIMIRRV